ncbi:MAG: hypothetical protein LBC80_10205 [Treponema sp.]|nr:hypothetical protein [Treponema sp.]
MNQLIKTIIGKPEKWLIEAAANIGLDLVGFAHEITNYFVNHGLKKHGNEAEERARGQLPVTLADISRIPDIIKNPDAAIIGINRYDIPLIAYSKKIDDGTLLYLEEVLNGKRNKALRSKTIYKKMGSISNETFFKIIGNNAKTDMSKTKMVVGAGGHPGG